jgi:hypothetical protein
MAWTQPEPMPELVLTEEQEERMGRLPPELQREYRRVLEMTMWRERSRKLEGPRVTLPPDNNRWGASAPPPPSTPAAELPSRPSGWQKFDPIGPPPGVDICDRMMDAQDRRDKAALIEAERLAYRQQVIDAHWEDKLIEEQRRRKQAERTCHVGPDDPDFDVR